MEIEKEIEQFYINLSNNTCPFLAPGLGFTKNARASFLTSRGLSKEGYLLLSQSKILQGAQKTLLASFYTFKALSQVFIPLASYTVCIFFVDYELIFICPILSFTEQINLDSLLKHTFDGASKAHFLAIPIFLNFISSCLMALFLPGITYPFILPLSKLSVDEYWPIRNIELGFNKLYPAFLLSLKELQVNEDK